MLLLKVNKFLALSLWSNEKPEEIELWAEWKPLTLDDEYYERLTDAGIEVILYNEDNRRVIPDR